MTVPQIIIAEDEPQLRHLIGEMLSANGLNAIPAEDGAVALQLIKDHPGASLLLSDVRMPRMNGYELVDAALAIRPELKILMMTAYAEELPPPAALRAREIRTLHKPVDLDRLHALISDMLARP